MLFLKDPLSSRCGRTKGDRICCCWRRSGAAGFCRRGAARSCCRKGCRRSGCGGGRGCGAGRSGSRGCGRSAAPQNRYDQNNDKGGAKNQCRNGKRKRFFIHSIIIPRAGTGKYGIMETRRDGSPSGGLGKIVFIGIAFRDAERFKVLKGKAAGPPTAEMVALSSAHTTDQGPSVGRRSMF